MPSLTKSTNWFVRVDGNHEFLKAKFIEMKTSVVWMDKSKVLAFLHTGLSKENPHAHFVISLSSELQKQSFDVRVRKFFNITKKSEYSSKVWDGGNETIAYMFHEETQPIYNEGFDSLTIETAQEHNKVVQKVISVNKEKSSGRLLDKILDKVGSDNTLEEIAEVALELIYTGDVYHPGDFKLKSVISDAYIKTRPKADWDEIKRKTAIAFAFDIKKYLF